MATREQFVEAIQNHKYLKDRGIERVFMTHKEILAEAKAAVPDADFVVNVGSFGTAPVLSAHYPLSLSKGTSAGVFVGWYGEVSLTDNGIIYRPNALFPQIKTALPTADLDLAEVDALLSVMPQVVRTHRTLSRLFSAAVVAAM